MRDEDLRPEAGIVLSALLRGAAGLSLLFVPMLLLHGVGALFASGLAGKGLFLAGLFCAAYGIWLGKRLELDARLFAGLARGCPSEAVLDDTLAGFLGRSQRARAMSDRLAGTRGLCLRLLAAAVLTLVCFACGVGADYAAASTIAPAGKPVSVS